MSIYDIDLLAVNIENLLRKAQLSSEPNHTSSSFFSLHEVVRHYLPLLFDNHSSSLNQVYFMINDELMNCPLQKIDVANPIYFLCHSEPTSCWILSRRSKPIEMCPEIEEVFWLWLAGPKEWEAVKKVEEI